MRNISGKQLVISFSRNLLVNLNYNSFSKDFLYFKKMFLKKKKKTQFRKKLIKMRKKKWKPFLKKCVVRY